MQDHLTLRKKLYALEMLDNGCNEESIMKYKAPQDFVRKLRKEASAIREIAHHDNYEFRSKFFRMSAYVDI